ncbi:MAG: hypothetical protein HZC10_08310 [Nitrospirae bacterium]|nr:hypothetical protein [Nitrospirota bacterium]
MKALEELQKLIPWLATLPPIPKVILSVIIVSSAALLLTLIWAPPKPPTQPKTDKPSERQQSIVVGQGANVGTLIQAQTIVGLSLSSKPADPMPNTVSFVVEGVRARESRFQVLFSLWNMTVNAIKVFDVSTKEYARIHSFAYYGGPRAELVLRPDQPSTLWSGETYEIPSRESASFNLSYLVDTGPADGEPWVVFGITVRYHQHDGRVISLPSDALFLYRKGQVFAIRPTELDSLRDLKTQLYTSRTVQDWADRIHRMVAGSFDKHRQGGGP